MNWSACCSRSTASWRWCSGGYPVARMDRSEIRDSLRGGSTAAHYATLDAGYEDALTRQRPGAFAERALHHHGVQPAAELEADIRVGADHREAASFMHADRTCVGGIADHRD